MSLSSITKKAVLAIAISLPMMAAGTHIANAGECSRSYKPVFVRMANQGVYYWNWKSGGRFDHLDNWNSVVGRYGVSVQWAQGHTCGCTQTSGNPPIHRNGNSICQDALDAGLN